MKRDRAGVKKQEEYTKPEWDRPENDVTMSTVFGETLPNEDDWVVLFPCNGQDMINDYVYKCVSSILVQSHKPFLWSQRTEHTLSALHNHMSTEIKGIK